MAFIIHGSYDWLKILLANSQPNINAVSAITHHQPNIKGGLGIYPNFMFIIEVPIIAKHHGKILPLGRDFIEEKLREIVPFGVFNVSNPTTRVLLFGDY